MEAFIDRNISKHRENVLRSDVLSLQNKVFYHQFRMTILEKIAVK